MRSWAAAAAIGLLALLPGASPARADLRRFTPVAAKSEVSFTASFPLGDFTGRTQDIAGEFRADPADLRSGVTGMLRIKAYGIRTGDEGRDREMYRLLAVDRHPEIQFTIERIEASFPSTTDRSDVLLTDHRPDVDPGRGARDGIPGPRPPAGRQALGPGRGPAPDEPLRDEAAVAIFF